jgi:hypothetical protein
MTGGRKVMLAIPSYQGTVHVSTLLSVTGDATRLAQRGDTVDIAIEAGISLIALARAFLVARFLRSDCTDLIMADADTAWEAGGMLRLLDHSPDFVAALAPYRTKPTPDDSALFPIRCLGTVTHDPSTRLVKVQGVALAFARLRRSVLERMVEAYPRLKFKHCDVEGWDLFAHGTAASRKLYIAEDTAFCMRWTAIDGEIWLDPEITMQHSGMTTFEGRLKDCI